MDFDDHDEADDEIRMPVGSGYDNPMNNNSSRGGAATGGAKLGSGSFGSGGGAEVAAGVATGTGSRRTSSGTGGGKYRECLKNHAVGIGGHAVDGCGEFMAAGEEGTLDALQCAACSCHRNFHRKETTERGNGAAVVPMEAVGYHPQFSPYYRTPATYLHPHHHMSPAAQQQHLRPHAPLALPSTSGGGGGGNSSRDDQDDVSNHMMAMAIGGSGGLGMGMSSGMGASGSGSGKKRFRTKFTQEQKDKMLAFAERIGWRIQKHDEAAVQQFCNETGVKRHVLKVWMHNNKHTLGKKP